MTLSDSMKGTAVQHGKNAEAHITIPEGQVRRGTSVCISGPSLPDSAGDVVGLEDGVLRIRCDRRIPDTTAATISFDHIQLAGTVLGSEPMGGDWGISVALNFSRRREARLPVNGKVTVGVVSSNGTKLHEAFMIDVSPSGFSLRVPLSVPLGARIYIETTAEIILAEVRHCRATGDGQFIIGAMVTQVVKDSRMQGQFAAFWGSVRRRMGFGGIGGAESLRQAATTDERNLRK